VAVSIECLKGAFKLVLRERIENVDPDAEVLQIKETGGRRFAVCVPVLRL